jgi:hypothetical protein
MNIYSDNNININKKERNQKSPMNNIKMIKYIDNTEEKIINSLLKRDKTLDNLKKHTSTVTNKTFSSTPKNNNGTSSEKKFNFKKVSSNQQSGNIEISINGNIYNSHSNSKNYINSWNGEYSSDNIVYIDLEDIKNNIRKEIRIEDNEEEIEQVI